MLALGVSGAEEKKRLLKRFKLQFIPHKKAPFLIRVLFYIVDA